MYAILLNDEKYKVAHSLTYIMDQYYDILDGIRYNLLDFTIKLVKINLDNSNKILFDSEKRFGSISPWENIKINKILPEIKPADAEKEN
jgi:hypothetical protein